VSAAFHAGVGRTVLELESSLVPLFRASLLDAASAPDTGLAATLSLNGLRALSRGLVPIIEDVIPSLTLPDVPFDKLTLEGTLTGMQVCGPKRTA
jgi:hypothetical protein